MTRLRKQLLVAGAILLLSFAAVAGYACSDEYSARERVKAPEGTDYGFIPLDLLAGRTKYEKRDGGRVVFSLEMGPLVEGRIALARAGFGVGVLAAILLGAGLLTKPGQNAGRTATASSRPPRRPGND